jgi:hypothetical protein
MPDKLGNMESDQHASEQAAAQQRLEKNLQKMEAKERKQASEGETPTQAEQRRLRQNRAASDKVQGDYGEGIGLKVASEKLDMIPDPRFDQTGRGIDTVCHDREGNMVIVESKCTKAGIDSLRKGQASPEWTEKTAKKMQNEKSDYYTPGNKEIGMEIDRRGAENVRRIVVTSHPESPFVKAYEGQKDGKWIPIGQWDADEFEQPYPQW